MGIFKKKKKVKEDKTFTEEVFSFLKTLINAVIVVMIINGVLVASFVVPTASMENEVMTGDFLFVNKFIYGPSTPQVIPFINQELPFYKFPGIKDPEKGDVIVFIYPGDRDRLEPKEFQYYLKRCIASAGDTLKIVNEKVFVNGELQQIPENANFSAARMADMPASFPIGTEWTHANYGPLIIPAKGDIINLNRANIERWRIFIMREGHDVSYVGDDIYIDDKVVTEYEVERDYCFGMGDNRRNSQDSRDWGFIPYENVVGTPLIVYWSWDTNLPFFSEFFTKLTTIRWDRIGTIID